MEEKKTQPVLSLVKGQSIYKIVIPQEVEKKIRLICKNIWEVEWSGVLFYKVEGAFEDKSLTIRCVDICLMDIGTSGATEFKVTPEVSAYMVDHSELTEEGVFSGLIHSHNNMASFFSGTDTSTLLSEGSDMAHFVSLIVNNAGSYTAGITRRIKCSQNVHENTSFITWNNKYEHQINTFDIEEEKIEWFNLAIVFENPDSTTDNEIINRIREIKATKIAEEAKKVPINSMYKAGVYPQNGYNSYGNYNTSKKDFSPVKDAELPFSNYTTHWDAKSGWYNEEPSIELPSKKDESFNDPEDYDLSIPYGVITTNPDLVSTVVKQIITSSIIIPNESAVDITKWANNMDSLYTKRFNGIPEFEAFASSYIDFIVNNTIDNEVLMALEYDNTAASAIIAYDVMKVLSTLPKSIWLDTYIEQLNDYIL